MKKVLISALALAFTALIVTVSFAQKKKINKIQFIFIYNYFFF